MTSKSLSPAVTRPRVGSSLRATPVPREKIRDPIRTKNRILKIAAQEFAEKGFDGVRIDRIVSKCGISKSLLYHYFSSKEDLFTQVMELSYASMRSHQDGVDLVSRHPIEDMRALVLSMVEHYAQEPEFIRLLATENVHKAEHIKNSHAIQDMYNPLRLKIRRILKEGQKAGLFRKDVD
jgi:TetR/AcrR family transcriptional regulator